MVFPPRRPGPRSCATETRIFSGSRLAEVPRPASNPAFLTGNLATAKKTLTCGPPTNLAQFKTSSNPSTHLQTTPLQLILLLPHQRRTILMFRSSIFSPLQVQSRLVSFIHAKLQTNQVRAIQHLHRIRECRRGGPRTRCSPGGVSLFAGNSWIFFFITLKPRVE